MSVDLEEHGLALVRETLEGVLDSSLAAVVLLEALGSLPDDEALPADAEALFTFAGGALAGTLLRHLPPAEADRALGAVSEVLRAAVAGTDVETPFSDRPSRVSTRTMTSSIGPTRLLVVARSRRLERRIVASVGLPYVDSAAAHDLAAAADLRKRHYPDVIIVDGQDAADINPLDLANTLKTEDVDQMIVVWASDQPWGSAISRALEALDARYVTCPRAEGVAPLVDYVRARLS